MHALEEELDKSRKETSKHQMDTARLTAHIEFLEDRLKLYTGEADRHSSTIASLQEQKAKLSSALLAHEKQLQLLRFISLVPPNTSN